MEKHIVVVFGKPGAGKSYVAGILKKRFDYFSYNGDEALPPDMKEKILEKTGVTTDMRMRFLDNMVADVKKLSQTQDKIVVHQALITEYMRERFHQSFPNAQFIFVDCDDAVLKRRYMKRKYFNLGLAYLQVMLDAFEMPKLPHFVVMNNTEGPKEIIKQLQKIWV